MEPNSKRLRVARAVPILSEPPSGLQLEVLTRRGFKDFVEKRFRNVGDRTFEQRLRKLARLRAFRPLLRYQRQPYYSPLQVVTFHHGEKFGKERSAQFDALVALIHELQDFYIPEVRSNGRTAPWIKSRNFLNVTETYSVSAIRDWRRSSISSGDINLEAAIQRFGLTIEQLEWWRREIAATVKGVDPLLGWHDLVAKVAYEERQKLRYEALLARDYDELGNVLVLLLRDLGVIKPHEELLDVFDLSSRDEDTGAPAWRVKKYGREHLDDHFFQLELIANDYDLNSKPRGIIFTEGDEWQALRVLFAARGFHPTILGIEFRSIFGIGNFNFQHWRAFIEYMHEKQVLIFFAIDSERPDLARQIAAFTTKKRLNLIDGLTKVMPTQDRICKWERSFEESNFTDEEIAQAMTQVGHSIDSAEVAQQRQDPQRTHGLAKALLGEESAVSKPALDIALINDLIRTSDSRGELRAVEKFVDDAGGLIALNHQPTHSETISMNRKSGYLG